MKKTFRLTLAVLALALIICSVFAISTFAEGEKTVTIEGYNLSYGSNIKIMYAVTSSTLAEGEKLVLNVYDGYPGAEGTTAYTVTDYEISEDEAVAGASVFFSPGIPLKNMTMTVFAQASIVDAEGNVVASSDMTKYSVLEYILERQIKYNAETTAAQKKFYHDLYEVGESAQQVLNYNTSSSVYDYFFLTATDGTYQGFTQGTVKANELVSLTYTGTEEIVGWNVTPVVVNSNGSLTVADAVFVPVGTEIPVTSHAIIEPATEAPVVEIPEDYYGQGAYYLDNSKTGLRFDCSAFDKSYNDSWFNDSSKASIVDGTLHIADTAGNAIRQTHWKPTAYASSDATVTLELDVKFDSVSNTNPNYNSSNTTCFTLYGNASTLTIFSVYTKDGNIYFAGQKLAAGYWYNLRMVVTGDDEASLYINGELKFTYNFNDATANRPEGLVQDARSNTKIGLALFATGGSACELYMDNVYASVE